MELSIRRFIVGNLRFAPDAVYDLACQDLLNAAPLNQVSQDLGLNSVIRVTDVGELLLVEIQACLSDMGRWSPFASE
jgi:hypothetical protein